MSILANLLKKQDQRHHVGQIPPGLMRTVSREGGGSAMRRRYLVVMALVVAAMTGGGLLAVYLQTRILAPLSVPHQEMSIQSKPLPTPVSVLQHPQSSAKTVASDMLSAAQSEYVVKKQPPAAVDHVPRHSAHVRSKPDKASPDAVGSERSWVIRDRTTLDAYLFAARGAETRHEFPLAMQQYRKALELDPQNYKILNNLASVSLSAGQPDEALRYANLALQQKDDYVSALINGGIAQGKMGNGIGARTMLGRAVAVDATNRVALYNLALSQEQGGLFDDAMNSYRRLSDSRDAQGMLGMARIRERRGERYEALRLYRETVTLAHVSQAVREAARERISVLDR
jgi:Flp pilus assembly protein TadD